MVNQLRQVEPSRQQWTTAILAAGVLFVLAMTAFVLIRAFTLSSPPVSFEPLPSAMSEVDAARIVALETQLERERETSNTILQLALFTIGTVLTARFALFVFGWWSNRQSTEQERDRLRDAERKLSDIQRQTETLFTANVERALDLWLDVTEASVSMVSASDLLDSIAGQSDRHDLNLLSPAYAGRIGRLLLLAIDQHIVEGVGLTATGEQLVRDVLGRLPIEATGYLGRTVDERIAEARALSEALIEATEDPLTRLD